MDKLFTILTFGIEKIPFLDGYKTKIGVLLLTLTQAYQVLQPTIGGLPEMPESLRGGLMSIGTLFAGVGGAHKFAKNGGGKG